MKVSQNNQRLQKTKYLGPSAKDRVELENRQRVHREFSATSKRENDEFEYGSLERILSRENLNNFYKQIGSKLEKIYLTMSMNQCQLEELKSQNQMEAIDY